MKALKFNLSGETAFFKKPDVNTYLYFTYGNIHKVAVLGILGAVLGLKGYNLQGKESYPEFFNELSSLKIAIIPRNDRGYIPKKVQIFNNTVGYASQEEGGNLITQEQWLEKPEWDIYVLLEGNPHVENIKERFLNYNFVYVPYLGKNDHYANIKAVSLVELMESDNPQSIHSLYQKSCFDLSSTCSSASIFDDDYEYDEQWKYEERLPVALEEHTNQYITESCIFTNMRVSQKEKCTLYSDEGNVLFFL